MTPHHTTPHHTTPKHIILLVIFALMLSVLRSGAVNAQQMEEVIVYGVGPQAFAMDDVWRYVEANNQYIFDRDLDERDREEDAEAHEQYCDWLFGGKPEQCTLNPGSTNAIAASNYVDAFFPSWGFWDAGILRSYRNLFRVSLTMAAVDYSHYQDSNRATIVFLESAADSCLNGAGQDIDPPPPLNNIPVSNGIICLSVAGLISDRMYPNFLSTGGFSVGNGIISIPVDFKPWGNKFYANLDSVVKCSSWYRRWSRAQCGG